MNRTQPSWGVEVALVAVTAVVTVGFARLFVDGSYLGPLLAVTLVAHALAIVTRRLDAPGWLIAAIVVGAPALILGAVLFGDTTAWGLPTLATWHAAADALTEARDQFRIVVAPTEALDGFLLASGLVLWAAAWFADWAEHRVDATVEAVGPAAAIFVFCSILGSGRYQVAAAVAFAAAVLCYVALGRVDRVRRRQAWSPTTTATTAALRRSALALSAVALLGGALVGPALPGADEDAALTWRGRAGGDRSRVTVSPMVELRKRLVDQSDLEVFEVRSEERAYWRLTSLDRFDGEIWSSNGQYREAREDLPGTSPTTSSTTFEQEIEIQALSTIWAPSAFEAVGLLDSSDPLRWDEESSTLIVDSTRTTSDGLTYTVVTRVPTLSPLELETAGTVDPASISDRYEDLPDDFPDEVIEQAREVTQQSESRYEQALALQNWFRDTFEYSLDSPAGHGDDALLDFLDSRVGYCEQFAGTYAAMARALGIPARVAVGFTPGTTSEEDPEVFQVLGRHAHAWPEVYFPQIGWVPFEPTPQRGIPGTESYTGVPEQQVADLSDSATTSAAPTTTAPTTTPSDTPESEQAPSQTRTTPGTEASSTDAADEGSSRWPLVLGAAGALVAAAVVASLLLRRRRHHAQAAALAPVDAAWASVERHLALHFGLPREPSETHAEYARRASDDLGDAAAELIDLAALVTRDRWSAEGVDPEAVAEAQRLAARILAVSPKPAGEPATVS